MASISAYPIAITATSPDGSAISGESGSVDLTINDACTAISAVTAPVTTAQAADLDGTSLAYTVPSWTAVAEATDCEPGLTYTWDVPATLVSDSTTSTSSLDFAFTSSTVALAGTYTITVTATTSTGAAIATGNTASFTLTLTDPNPSSSSSSSSSSESSDDDDTTPATTTTTTTTTTATTAATSAVT